MSAGRRLTDGTDAEGQSDQGVDVDACRGATGGGAGALLRPDFPRLITVKGDG